jgi:hypothetical protein
LPSTVDEGSGITITVPVLSVVVSSGSLVESSVVLSLLAPLVDPSSVVGSLVGTSVVALADPSGDDESVVEESLVGSEIPAEETSVVGSSVVGSSVVGRSAVGRSVVISDAGSVDVDAPLVGSTGNSDVCVPLVLVSSVGALVPSVVRASLDVSEDRLEDSLVSLVGSTAASGALGSGLLVPGSPPSNTRGGTPSSSLQASDNIELPAARAPSSSRTPRVRENWIDKVFFMGC